MPPCSIHEIPRATLMRERELRCLTNAQRLQLATVVELPYSEACCHMRVAGQRRPVIPVGAYMAQILNSDGSLFSFPVTRGEAGLAYHHNVSAQNCRAATQNDRIISCEHCEVCE